MPDFINLLHLSDLHFGMEGDPKIAPGSRGQAQGERHATCETLRKLVTSTAKIHKFYLDRQKNVLLTNLSKSHNNPTFKFNSLCQADICERAP